ncbi:hypothetical protein U1Q18_029429 [Sarracenia purpurea var. burkii]
MVVDLQGIQRGEDLRAGSFSILILESEGPSRGSIAIEESQRDYLKRNRTRISGFLSSLLKSEMGRKLSGESKEGDGDDLYTYSSADVGVRRRSLLGLRGDAPVVDKPCAGGAVVSVMDGMVGDGAWALVGR